MNYKKKYVLFKKYDFWPFWSYYEINPTFNIDFFYFSVSIIDLTYL